MSEPSSPSRGWIAYSLIVLVTAGIAAGVTALLMNIRERKKEGEQFFTQIVSLSEDDIDPARWGQNFPRQYASYRLTVDSTHTQHGGSEGHAVSKLETDPRLKRIFAGYAFALDFREARGHAYMLADQKVTKRVVDLPGKQTGACLHCHSSVIPAYRQQGDGDIQKGFEKVCAMPIEKAFGLVEHPVSCIDCHDPKTMVLRVLRPAFLAGIAALAEGDGPVPHLPSIERWRKGSRQKPYDPNTEASRQEMRSFVCGQCHVEYYFKGSGKVVTYPWHKGLKMDDAEAYYEEQQFTDWTHAETKAPMLKAQHPEFEMWSQGIHARSGVACADCHMPYVREGAIKVSDHNVRSPMLNVARACQTCHRYAEEEIKGRVKMIQDRHLALMSRAEDALLELMDTFRQATAAGTAPEQLDKARKLHRRAQWRVDYVNAENSRGFHAAQEGARILGEAIDFARQGQIELLRRK